MNLFLSSLVVLTGSAFLILLTAPFIDLCTTNDKKNQEAKVDLPAGKAGILTTTNIGKERVSKKISRIIFLISLTTGCVLGMISAVGVLVNPAASGGDYRLNIRMPLGEFYVGIDSLSAFFLLMVTILFFWTGIYGYGYFRSHEKKNPSVHYAFYLLTLIALMLVVTAKNAVLFLMAWEMMAISSYFLIIFYDEQKAVQKAGYLYLIAAHTGTFCLSIMFLLMAQHTGLPAARLPDGQGQAGSMNFDQMTQASFPLPLAGLIFVLGVLGFGVKTGFIPLHIWLPHAHPAAPSHVSAVLSGVIIKMGIYGLMRMVLIIKDFPEWCAVVLLLIGIISGVGGVLYALGQHEIKKLLAYHSIENIGIITLGLGIGLWGQIYHNDLVAIIGYAGALLHVFNHAIFKGLLFLSAGSVIRSTHTGEIDRMGGLLKYLPWTGHLFLIGSLSICGLPLFNGFISEWLVFRALFEGMFHLKMNALIFSSLGIIALALIGGLAAACFAKAFGAIFLGNSRSIDNTQVKENSWAMRAPMAVLGGICLWIGLFPTTMVSFALRAASTILSIEISPVTERTIISPLLTVILLLVILIVTAAVLVLLKRISMKVLPIEKAPTWGCGYSAPTSRMQYTASSFAEPILRIFRSVLSYGVRGNKLRGYFPKVQEVSSHVVETSEEFIFRPVFQSIQFLSARLKIIQYGYTQLYLLYMFVFLLALLIWKMV